MNKREAVSNMADDTIMVISEEFYDEALVGIVERNGMEPVAIYDKQKVIELIVKHYGFSDWIEALEHFEYNIIGSFVGEHTPAFLTLIEGSEITWRTKRKFLFVARSVEMFRPIWAWVRSVRNAGPRCPRLRPEQKARLKKRAPKILWTGGVRDADKRR